MRFGLLGSRQMPFTHLHASKPFDGHSKGDGFFFICWRIQLISLTISVGPRLKTWTYLLLLLRIRVSPVETEMIVCACAESSSSSSSNRFDYPPRVCLSYYAVTIDCVCVLLGQFLFHLFVAFAASRVTYNHFHLRVPYVFARLPRIVNVPSTYTNEPFGRVSLSWLKFAVNTSLPAQFLWVHHYYNVSFVFIINAPITGDE